jgi:protein transport protein SEC24
MAAPQGGYPPQEGYGQQAPPAPGYGSPASPPPPPGSVPAQAGGKKKRAYAGEAFDFGSGANAALGGQQPGGGNYTGAYAAQAAVAGYTPAGYGPDPAAGYVSPQPVGVGEYQPPTAGYPAPSAAGIAQVTQQFGQLGVSDPHQLPPQLPPQQVPRAIPLNQLYPTDLLTQPFNVAELDYPPPPIILPPNVRSEPPSLQVAPSDQATNFRTVKYLPFSLC